MLHISSRVRLVLLIRRFRIGLEHLDDSSRMRKSQRLLCVTAVASCMVVLGPGGSAHGVVASASPVAQAWQIGDEWGWPVLGHRVVAESYRAPAQPWLSGHRGIDIAVIGPVRPVLVRAPADGVVAFVGTVVDRELITISHAGNLVTTLEPVHSELSPGTTVTGGEVVGVVSTGGHTPHGLLHFGVRWHGEYINPMQLYGGIPRAVLLPCC